MTFVCEGRIALQAAQIFLQEFGKQKIPDVAKPIVAAGVAIVKAHYPFARAYQLAEALTSNAKKESERAYPALDWHLARSGIFDQLGLMRERQYNDGTLLMRPLAITGGKDWRTWENFVGLVAGLLTATNGDPTLPRNQVMDLRRALRQSSSTDPSPVRQITGRLETRHLPLPELSIGSGVYQKDGWLGTRCVYYDAIEMKDQLAESTRHRERRKAMTRYWLHLTLHSNTAFRTRQRDTGPDRPGRGPGQAWLPLFARTHIEGVAQ